MPQREFEITIAPDGEVEVHIQGYKGASACKSAAAIFEKAVGAIRASQATSEAYEPEETVHQRADHRH